MRGPWRPILRSLPPPPPTTIVTFVPAREREKRLEYNTLNKQDGDTKCTSTASFTVCLPSQTSCTLPHLLSAFLSDFLHSASFYECLTLRHIALCLLFCLPSSQTSCTLPPLLPAFLSDILHSASFLPAFFSDFLHSASFLPAFFSDFLHCAYFLPAFFSDFLHSATFSDGLTSTCTLFLR